MVCFFREDDDDDDEDGYDVDDYDGCCSAFILNLLSVALLLVLKITPGKNHERIIVPKNYHLLKPPAALSHHHYYYFDDYKYKAVGNGTVVRIASILLSTTKVESGRQSVFQRFLAFHFLLFLLLSGVTD